MELPYFERRGKLYSRAIKRDRSTKPSTNIHPDGAHGNVYSVSFGIEVEVGEWWPSRVPSDSGSRQRDGRRATFSRVHARRDGDRATIRQLDCSWINDRVERLRNAGDAWNREWEP